jgi:hypothetical protein
MSGPLSTEQANSLAGMILIVAIVASVIGCGVGATITAIIAL